MPKSTSSTGMFTPKTVRQYSLMQSAVVPSLLTLSLAMIIFAVIRSAFFGLSLAVDLIGAFGLVFGAVGIAGTLYLERKAEEGRRNYVKETLGEDSSSGKYFESLVNINLENLSAYYVTVKGHANKSFVASLFVGLVGFALIGMGIYLTIKGNGPTVGVLSGAAGVATQFVSAIFFYLYSQTVRQMKEYHDSLLAVQNILLAFKLLEDSADPEEKSKMMGVMLEYLMQKRLGLAQAGGGAPYREAEGRGNTPEMQGQTVAE
ncbi:MAG: hypothetical protein ABR976_11840 [Terracidiphilus sp.]